MSLEKWKDYNKKMCPSKCDIIALCISLLVGAVLLDFNMENSYTFSLISAVFVYEVCYLFTWTIFAVIVAFLYKRKQKKEREVKQENEDK